MSLINKTEEVKYFLFDFDGTLYPGLFLLDLALDFFKQRLSDNQRFTDGYVDLLNLITNKENYSFIDQSTHFARILKGINCHEFNSGITKFMDKCYPRGVKFVKHLTKKGKECFMVSLTSREIANAAKNKFGFKDCYYREIGREIKDGVEVFSGLYLENVRDLAEYKEACLDKFGLRGKKFFMAGNAKEDSLLLSEAYIKVLINPDKRLLGSRDVDMIFVNGHDPWADTLLEKLF